jgi:hypothetical protein
MPQAIIVDRLVSIDLNGYNIDTIAYDTEIGTVSVINNGERYQLNL